MVHGYVSPQPQQLAEKQQLLVAAVDPFSLSFSQQ
jgi:hypothetical protein